MIRKLFDRITNAVSASSEASEEERDEAIRLATAVLMIDVAQADDHFDESEFERVISLIEQQFGLSAEQAAALLGIGERSFRERYTDGRVPAPALRDARTIRWSRRELIVWTCHGCPPGEQWQTIWRHMRGDAALAS